MITSFVMLLAHVRLWFPEEMTPGFGLIRAVVVDSADPSSPQWVDSDGQVTVNFSSRLTPSLEAGQVAAASQNNAGQTQFQHAHKSWQLHARIQWSAEACAELAGTQ